MTSLGRLIVITGPSGVGKGSLVQQLLQRNKDLWLSISATTRKPRHGEKDGQHYFFLEKEQFEKSIEIDGFLEWAEFAGNFYGTPKNEIQNQLDKNKIVLLEIELEGARQIRKTFPEAFQIFLAPPNLEELEKRIRGRGTDEEEAIQRRLLRAKQELKAKDEFDEVVINDDLEKTIIAVENLLNDSID